MNNNILLTIAIPTFNRAEYLDICLNQFAKQIEPYKDIIEVIVTNNCSTDNTSEILDNYTHRFPVFQFETQKDNIGADRNFEWCFRKSRGKYLWIFGDDDLLLEKKLELIINILEDRKPDILFAKGYGYEKDYNLEFPVKKPLIEKEKYRHFKNKKKYLRNVHYYVTFASGNIFNKSLLPSDYNSARFIGTNLNHVNWILEVMMRGKDFGIINEMVMAIKTNNTGGYKLFETFSTNLNIILAYLNKERSMPYFVNRIINFNLLLTFFPQYVSAYRNRSNDKFNNESPLSVLRLVYDKNIWFWMFVAPVFALPLKLGRFYLTKVLNNINRVKNVFV